ncbi:MAG TPA: inositol monophosphatase family protein [Acidimicrobiia bacterium]|nr:inositol monophosphatase family protein [Acidimicrobiia bacterium]
MDIAEHLELALSLADTADALTMERFRSIDLRVDTKPDRTPVTEADHAVERAVRLRLTEHVQEYAVVGEEFGVEGDDDSEFRWIIDPIDGTKGYLRGLPVWATLLALEHRGQLVVGVVSAPALGARWWAARGQGAHRNGEPIGVSAVHELADAHLSFAWDTDASFERDGLDQRLLALGRRCWRVRSFGDFWHHMLVAEGAIDISVDPAAAWWDLAAIAVIVEEAGGRATDLDGVARADGGNIVCTNGRLHDSVLDVLTA